jgi:hypothetical protein
MTRIKMIGLAVLAVCAVMAVAAASAMAAAENPVLVNAAGGAVTNVSVTGKSLEGTVPTWQTTATGAAKIECTKGETSSGKLTTKLEGTGMTSGSETVTFNGCKTAAGECENAGAGSKEITGTLSILLVWVGKESNKTIGLLFSILPYTGLPGSQNQLLSFVCSGELLDFQGSFITLTKQTINVASTKGSVIAKGTNGKQQDLTYTESGIEGTNTAYSDQNHGPFGVAAWELETEETYSTIVKVINN